jgi:GPI mannosyltransferase 2
VIKAFFLSLLVACPTVLHQIAGYAQFCTVSTPHDWCKSRLPLIYSHVQSQYWDVGLFRYWTPAQLPNYVLAAPSLALLLWASWTHLKRHGYDKFYNISQAVRAPNPNRDETTDSLLTSRQITPHAIHAFVLCLILIFASHTQIVLRLSSSLPFTYWAAARLWVEKPHLAKWWTGWTALWSTISLVTWGLFLPPA